MTRKNSCKNKSDQFLTSQAFKFENKLLADGYDFVIGVDEAGRGPLAGPVVACATTIRKFQIPNNKSQTNSNDQISNDKKFIKNLNLIRDSKKLSEKQRERIYEFICEHFHIGIGICDHVTIDRINILEATYLAMKKAIASLARETSNKLLNFKFQNSKHIILVDGNKTIPGCSYEQHAIVGGDDLITSISAASIIAKVTRDQMMREFHQLYPQYNFFQHKGYGTKEHMAMIRRHGPCEIHRKTFRPFA